MAVGVKRGKKGAVVVYEADQIAALDADTFLLESANRAAAAKRYKAAKTRLKTWLGTETSRILPDGRTVNLSTVPRAGFTVADGTVSTMTIIPATAPA
jgi:hypothetical protein